MNNNVSPMWHQSHESNAGNGAPDLNDDFSSFLNFNDIPLSMSSPFNTPGDEPLAMDTDFCLDGNTHSATSDVNQQMPNVSQTEIMNMQFHELQKSMAAHQQMINQQMHQQRHQHGGIVPPTPSSMEMHGGLPQATLHNMNSRMIIDRFGMYREEPMIFTPLVSPAVTPLETEFSHHIPDFIMPGAFSPLTSPALAAHHHRTHMSNPHMSHNPAPMQALTDPSQSPVLGRKGSIPSGRRKSTTSRNPARVVRESPSMKPQRKRTQLLAQPAVAPKPYSTLAQQAQIYGTASHDSGSAQRDSSAPVVSQQSMPMEHPRSQEHSSNESVSPEPLPEVLMAPPPRRSLSSQSPNDDGSTASQKPLNAPVTPASLMRLPKTSLPTEDIPPISMDTSEYLNREVETPDQLSANNVNGDQHNEEMTTPTLNHSSSRTPSLTPSLRPSNSRGASRHTSPLEPHNPGAMTKKESVRSSRKRGSVSSSPALHPKISPHIKPLLPMGMSPDASAFLLASKSNYQNIVEGNHSHLGLQYPEHLSTNLTSKRTSHKIAEQGRRNRINGALAEMAGLLPPINGGPSDGGATGKEQTSKASTVELAIDYIKQLKRELEETKARLKVAEEALGNVGAAVANEKERGKDERKEKEEEPGENVVEMETNEDSTTQVAVATG